MKSTIPGACLPAGRTVGRPAGDFENKTSTAPKLGLGLGAELGNKAFPFTNNFTKMSTASS